MSASSVMAAVAGIDLRAGGSVLNTAGNIIQGCVAGHAEVRVVGLETLHVSRVGLVSVDGVMCIL